MRDKFSALVEKGRDQRGGPYHSRPGDRFGAFLIRHPETGVSMQLIVSDGLDWGLSHLTLPPWEHVSVSVRQTKRTPTWEEMAWVKDLFWDSEETVVQIHPPHSQYVNVHPYVLHLWKPIGFVLPLPPRDAV